MSYTEDTLVQQTTADYLQHQLGWKSVYAYNHENFGPDSLLGRASDREVVLTRTLCEKLMVLNPNLPNTAYEDAVRQITATIASQTLAATNREKYEQMRDGVQVYKGKLSSLKRFKDDANEVRSGMECGMAIQNFTDFKVGDVIEAFSSEKIAAELGTLTSAGASN